MNSLDMETSKPIQQHQAIQAHTKFLINAVRRLDPQLCQEIADSTSLKNRILLYRWSLYDFKEAVQRHIELDKRIYPCSRSIEGILIEHQAILEQINNTIALAENAMDNKTIREELNVYLVKIIMAVNKICETIELHITKEDELVRKH